MAFLLSEHIEDRWYKDRFDHLVRRGASVMDYGGHDGS
jgi:hypothetical protein